MSLSIEPNQLFTYKELFKLLCISDKFARRLKSDGQLVPKKVGNKYIYTGQQVLDYINNEVK